MLSGGPLAIGASWSQLVGGPSSAGFLFMPVGASGLGTWGVVPISDPSQFLDAAGQSGVPKGWIG